MIEKKTQIIDQDDNMQLSLQPKIIVVESEINHSWQYAIKPKYKPISKYKKIKTYCKTKRDYNACIQSASWNKIWIWDFKPSR